jgi:hypothetical protein
VKKSLIALAALAASGSYGMYREQAGADGTVQSGTGTAAVEQSAPAPVAPSAPNDSVFMKEQTFHFKKEKDVTGPDAADPTKTVVLQKGEKHPSVKMYLPIPKRERLIQFLSDPTTFAKEVELIDSAIFDTIYTVARGQVNDFREKNPKETVTNAVLDYDKLDWTAIANMPKSERGAYAPNEEELGTFLDSYAAVMPAATQKTAEQIGNHIKLFKDGFKKQRGQKDILELFSGMLQVYMTAASTDDLEENMQVVEYFVNKLDRWLKAEEKITMDML